MAYSRAVLLFLFGTLLLAGATPAYAALSDNSLKVFAVAPDGTALSATLDLHIEPGTGKVWSSVSGPLVGTATQSTEKIAVKVAKNYFTDVEEYDYFFSIDSEASVVDGPSAGSAMALLVVGSLMDEKIPQNIGLTGTITNTGEVGPVGGVFEKSKEAAKDGIKLFLIPAGESKQVVKLEDGVKNIYLPEYALDEWGMKVIETYTLDEVLKYAFANFEDIDVNQTQQDEIPTYIPEKIEAAPSVQPMSALNTIFIAQTRTAITQAQNALNSTLLDDAGLIEALSRSLSESGKTADEAELLTQNGYHYSAGNFAFLARVNAYFVHDVSEDPDLIDLESSELDKRIVELSKLINQQQVQFDKIVPVEGVEWYIAAQQRLTWAQEQVETLQSTPIIVVATQDAAHAQAVGRVLDYEYAKAWYESSGEFYQVALQQSTKGFKTQSPFSDYYTDFIANAENGLSLIQDGSGEDAARRLDAALIDKANNRHLSAAMNAASSLGLINAILIENDAEKDVRETLEGKIESLEIKMAEKTQKFGWAHLYLDHAKFYLKSANYYQGINQGASAASSLSSGLSLILLAENTYEVTKDVEKYYEQLPPAQFTSLDGIAENYTPTNGVNGNVIPLNIGPDGKGSVVIQGNTTNEFPLTWVLGIIVVFLGAVLLMSFATRGNVSSAHAEGAPGLARAVSDESDSSNPASSRALFAVDELEAKLFAAKQGLRHAQYQHNIGHLSSEAFKEVESHYTEQIRATSKQLRGANMDLRKHEKNGKNTKTSKKPVNEPILDSSTKESTTKKWPAKKTSKKSSKKK
jgi:uncharacterized protein